MERHLEDIERRYEQPYGYGQRPRDIDDASIRAKAASAKPSERLAGEMFILRRRTILDLVTAEQSSARILDVGCGDGQLLAPIAGGRVVWGIDASRKALGQAEDRGYAKTHWLNLECDEWPVTDGGFDVVVCSEVIEHVVDTLRLVRCCLKALRVGGILIVTTPNAVSLGGRWRLLRGGPITFSEPFPRTSGHLRSFCPGDVAELLVAAGATDVSVRSAPLLLPMLWRHFAWARRQPKLRLLQNMGMFIVATGRRPKVGG